MPDTHRPGWRDILVHKGSGLNLQYFQTLSHWTRVSDKDGEWAILHFAEGGQIQIPSSRVLWVEPERH